MRALSTPSLLFVLACGDLAPGPAVVSLSPAVPTTTDDLVAVLDRESLDPEGRDLTYRYRWLRDGELIPEAEGDVLSADFTAKGEVWRVEVVASDGNADGPAMGAEVTVVDAAPTVTVAISPAQPQAGDDLTAEATAADADGDAVVLTWSWTRDGQATTQTGSTVPASAVARWQTWEVTVVPNDGEVDGAPASASVMVGNGIPSVTALTLDPAEPTEQSVITATAVAEDGDGDPIEIRWAWTVDGALVAGADTDTLDGTSFDKHQEVRVSATPWDGFEEGQTVTSDAVEVLDSAPTVESVALDPAEIYEASTVTCQASGAADADGDVLSFSTTWTVNGAAVSTASTIDGSLFSRGDRVACGVTVDDGELAGPTLASETAVVRNTLPTLAAVSLSPTAPVEGDTLVVSLSGARDDDGDALGFAYAWFVDGLEVSTDPQLGSGAFDKHQDIWVEVTPDDGLASGATVRSPTVTALNTPPTFTGVALDPAEAQVDGLQGFRGEGWTDPDGDAEGYVCSWLVDGAVVSTSQVLDLGPFDRGSTVAVEVTAWDGDDLGPTHVSGTVTILQLLSAADADVVLLGQRGEQAGEALALLGDVSADGRGDLAVGLPAADLGATDAGAVYLAPGDVAGSWDLDAVGYLLWASVGGDEAGRAVAGGVDLTGDGYPDLLVGAPGHDTGGTDAGVAWLVPGPVRADAALEGSGTGLFGANAGDEAGTALSLAGDVDGDGRQDLLVGAWGAGGEAGAAYLVLGPRGSDLDLAAADEVFDGEVAGDEAGFSVAGVGDVDGDGLDDLLIGAAKESSAGADAGAAYLVLGPASASGLGAADGKLLGEQPWDYAGYAVAGAGDTDGDGRDDLLVGARFQDSGGLASGAAYLVRGPTMGVASLSTADVKVVGSAASELAGTALAGLDDLDGDGLSEFAVGAVGAASLGANTGAVYVVSDPASGTLVLGQDVFALIEGDVSGDKLGQAVAGGRDLDGDGVPDLGVAAPYADDNGTSSGAACLFSGAGL